MRAVTGAILIGMAAFPSFGHPQQVRLKIMAFADGPVAGADVRVSVHGCHGRPLVEAQAATNRYGVVPIEVRSESSQFRITVSGGTTNGNPFPWHLSADVVLSDPAHQIVVVNPATTLVSVLMDERPNLKLDCAEALVRHFLKLPPNYSLGLALRQSSGYVSPFFSVAAFMTEAEAAGGLDAFEHLLLQELALDSATHSFRPPHLLGDTATSDIQAGLEAGVLDYAGANNVANLTGWAMSLTGLATGGASSGDIDALVNALTELQSEIENLSYEVAQLTNIVKATATQTQYTIITTQAQALANEVNGVESDLSYFANACPPMPDGSTPTSPSTYCTNEKVSVNTELSDLTIQQAYVTMEGYVQDNGTLGTEGMLHLYSLWLGQSKPFFRAADSTAMQNLYNYWDGVLTQAANLKVELLHENGAQDNPGGQKQLTDFLGNPTLSPPTTGTFQANQAVNLKLMFPPVPDGTVVTTSDHTMWSLNPWTQQGSTYSPAPACSAFTNPFLIINDYPPSFGQPSPPPPHLPAYAGFSNWEYSPSLAQWQSLVAPAPPLSSGTEWRDWLTAETQTGPDESPASPGWFNWTRICAGGYGAWSSTVVDGPITDVQGAQYYFYSYIITYNNSFQSQATPHLSGPSSTSLTVQYGFDWPVRSLAASEQYYWYN